MGQEITDISREVGELMRGLDRLCLHNANASSAEHRLTMHLMRLDMRDVWIWTLSNAETVRPG